LPDVIATATAAKANVLDELAQRRFLLGTRALTAMPVFERKPEQALIVPAVANGGPSRPAGLDLITSDKGAIKPCEYNARTLIEAAPEYVDLHFDDFRAAVRVGDRDWTDQDTRDVQCWLQQRYRVAGFTLRMTTTAILAVAHGRQHDSLQQFVLALPQWDGTARIAHAFADAWGASDDAMTCAASANLFLALIARAVQPGAQVDTLWAFEGAQGTGKSKGLRTLGQDYYAEITAPIGSTDFMRELRGKWIAELSELDSLRGKEASTIKRMLSSPTDRFVEKYETMAREYRRRCIATATTNEAAYWQDPTGARRLVPIRCTTIRPDIIADNRLQWFAEARYLHAGGATWWEFPASIEGARDERQEVDPWENTLRDLIANGKPTSTYGHGRTNWPDGFITTSEIMRDWLRLEPHQQGRPSGVRLGHVMRRLGFEPIQKGKARERGWQPNIQAPTDDECSPKCSPNSPYEANT
jgi:putative DNA primase/helicase